MKTLSKEAEAKIYDALNDVVNLVGEGQGVNEAMTKVASERNLPAGHINLMVVAYNVGRSENHRKTASSLLERASSFELADASKIMEKVFPTTSKTAGQIHDEGVVSHEYSYDPNFLKRETAATMTKKANEIIASMKSPEQVKPAKSQVEQVYLKMAQIRIDIQESGQRRMQAEVLLKKAFDALEGYLLSTSSTPFKDVQRNAAIMFGKSAEHLFLALNRSRRFDHQDTLGRTPILKTAMEKVAAVVEAAEKFNDANADFEEKSAQGFETVNQTFHAIRPKDTGGLAPEIIKQGFFGTVLGSSFGSTLGRSLGDHMSQNAAESRAKAQKKLDDPVQMAALRNLQTEAMLSNLLANDDVIKGYDPATVLHHYNELAQLSPRAANQTGAVRAILRQNLTQGVMDPFQVEGLLRMEKGLKDRDNTGGNNESGLL